MGATNTTPNLALPQFTDTDKPTWRGDINGAFQILDDAVHGKADKATIDYYVADYSGVGNGVTDDTAHIQAAIDAAAANGGGVVHLMRGKTHLINGEIFVKNNVLLMGDVANYNGNTGAANTPSIKYGTANSRIRVGAFAGRFGSANGENPNGIQNMFIDCNGHGPVAVNDGAIYIQGTGILCQAIHLKDAAGIGLYCDATQNCEFNSVDIQHCDTGICLDNGAGGLLFIRCEIADNMIGIQAIDNQSMANGYPLGVAHVTFEHCIVENYRPITMEVDIQAGTIEFKNCGFSNNVSGTAPTANTLVKVSNPIYPGISSFVIFDSCIFVSQAGEHLVTLNGPNQMYMYGQNYLQGSFTAGVLTTAFLQDSGVGTGQIDGNVYKLNINKLVDVINGGSLFNWFVSRYGTESHIVDTTINNFAAFYKLITDAGIRMAIGGDGSINFYNGADFNQKASISLNVALKTLYYNLAGHIMQGPVEFDDPVTMDQSLAVGTNIHVQGTSLLDGKVNATGDLEVHTNLTVDGSTTHTGPTINTGVLTNNGGVVQNGLVTRNAGTVEAFPIVYAPVGGGAVNVDARATAHLFCIITGTGNITSLVITNAVAGQKLRVSFLVSDGAPRNVFWPTGATPAAGKTLPASLTAVGFYSIDFVNVAGNWFEVGRNF